METPTTPTTRRIGKPPGVSILSAFDGIFIGLIPLMFLLVLDNHPKTRIADFDFYLTATLRVIVVASALGAMMGENLGRHILLWAVTAVSISMIIDGVGLLSGGDGELGISLVGNIIRGIFWIAINWWYFNRKGVAAYYKQK